MEEELSVATSSSLSLLVALHSPPAQFQADAALAACLPVLWPFLSHSITGVRLAAATSLGRIAAAGSSAAAAAGFDAAALAAVEGVDSAGGQAAVAAAAAEAAKAWLKPVVGPCLRLLMQCMVTERDRKVQQALLKAWSALMQHSRQLDVAAGLSANDLRCMLNLMATPCGSPLDTSLLVVPLQGRLVAWGSTDAEEAGLCIRPTKKVKQEPGTQGRAASVGECRLLACSIANCLCCGFHKLVRSSTDDIYWAQLVHIHLLPCTLSSNPQFARQPHCL